MSPTSSVFRTDNRSRYDGLSLHLQANVSRFSLVFNYTLSSAETWGCVLGELFDYVNGVCNPLQCLCQRRLRTVGRKRHAPRWFWRERFTFPAASNCRS